MKNFEKLDEIALLTSFISVANYIQNLKQTSNDELMKEIKEETNIKLDEIIKQNKEIMRMLNKEV